MLHDDGGAPLPEEPLPRARVVGAPAALRDASRSAEARTAPARPAQPPSTAILGSFDQVGCMTTWLSRNVQRARFASTHMCGGITPDGGVRARAPRSQQSLPFGSVNATVSLTTHSQYMGLYVRCPKMTPITRIDLVGRHRRMVSTLHNKVSRRHTIRKV